MFDFCPPEPRFHAFARVVVTNAGKVYSLSPCSARLCASCGTSVTHDCERDLGATMLRFRVASSAGVGRQSLTARGIATCRAHVTLTVILVRLLVLRSSSRFSRKREAARSVH